MGTAPIACPSLQALMRQPEFRVVAVVTQPDRPRGRDLVPQPSAVKTAAVEALLPVLQPERARSESFVQQLRYFNPALIVVIAYGQILPAAILELASYGCINVHASLLPRYRGAAPIQWALINGDRETGITIMKMDAGLDTGPMLSVEKTPIQSQDNSQTLHDRLAEIGARLLITTLRGYVAGKIAPKVQPAEGIFYARKITKEDGRLDWAHAPTVLHNRVRAFTPWPGAYTFLPGTPRPVLLKIWETKVEVGSGAGVPPGEVLKADRDGILVACHEGALRILSLQKEGSRRLTASEFLAGCPLAPGTRLLQERPA